MTSPRGPVSPRPATGVWKTPVSNVGDSLLVQDFASGSGHVTTLPCSGDYQSWLDVDASSAVGRGGGGGILQGRRRTAGRPGRSTVTFLSPVRDGRPGPSGGLGAALDDRPYAATLKAERCTAAVPMTVTASSSLPRRRHEVWPSSAGGGCPQCPSPRSVDASGSTASSGQPAPCRADQEPCGADQVPPSCVTDGRLQAASGEQWSSCRASPSDWPLNDDSMDIGVRLHSAEDTPV